MENDQRVIADGVEPEGAKHPRAPAPAVLIVGVLSGLVMATLLFAFTVGGEEEAAPSSTLSREVSEPTLPRFGVTAVVPDFPDAVVAVSGAYTGSGGEVDLQHVLWPATSNEVFHPLLTGSPGPVRFDVAGTWLAVSTVDEDGSGLELASYRGIVQAISGGVTSFAWNDSETGLLSFTAPDEGMLGIYTVRGTAPPEKVDSAFLRSGTLADGSVVAWGRWGWAIQDDGESPRVWLLDPDGELVSLVPGIAFGSHPSGRIVVVEGDQVGVVATDGSSVDLEPTRRTIRHVSAASISPDGTKLAVLGIDGLIVLPMGEEGSVAVFEPLVGSPQTAWSSDSRFLLVPGPVGVSVIDTDTNTYAEAFPGQMVLAVGVITLTSPS